jgi:hypothetical protein
MMRIDAYRSEIVIFFLLIFFAPAPVPLHAQGARLKLDNLEKLSAKATKADDVTLDGALLELATAFMKEDHDPETVAAMNIVKNIKGIYIKNFQFAQPNEYSQADLDSIRAQLAAPGWNRIVGSRDEKSGELNEIYLMKDGDNIAGMAILSAQPKQLSIVNIVGSVDLTKIGALAGNLGIPKDLNSRIRGEIQNQLGTAPNPKTGASGNGAQKIPPAPPAQPTSPPAQPSSQNKPAAPSGEVR